MGELSNLRPLRTTCTSLDDCRARLYDQDTDPDTRRMPTVELPLIAARYALGFLQRNTHLAAEQIAHTEALDVLQGAIHRAGDECPPHGYRRPA